MTASDARKTVGAANTYALIENLGYIRGMFWLAGIAEIIVILLIEAGLAHLAPAQYALKILLPKATIHDLAITPVCVAGLLLIAAGSWLRRECYSTLDKFFTFEITIREDHKLVTSGPYSIVRHPYYVAIYIVFIGQCLWYSRKGSWIRDSGVLDSTLVMVVVATLTAMYVKLMVNLLQRVPEEDKLMKATFKKEWEEWARKVPYGLLPGIY
ncbi:hypothetical protein H0H92_003613 [Tricholoma furcatifolium]|nr:hypothetical protein H0H92_003613 [Tricholoma furcatifolium]